MIFKYFTKLKATKKIRTTNQKNYAVARRRTRRRSQLMDFRIITTSCSKSTTHIRYCAADRKWLELNTWVTYTKILLPKNINFFSLSLQAPNEPEGEKNTSLKYFRCKYLLNTMIYRDRVLFDLHKIQLLTNSHV